MKSVDKIKSKSKFSLETNRFILVLFVIMFLISLYTRVYIYLSIVLSLLFIIRTTLFISKKFQKLYKYLYRGFKKVQELNETRIDKDRFLDNIHNQYKEYIDRADINFALGAISRSMIHDLSIAVNTINDGFEILSNERRSNKRLINKLAESLNQINMIVFETRELIQGREVIVLFDVSSRINTVIRILRNELILNNIQIKYKSVNLSYIKGTPGMFERIIMNLLLNSIEELKTKMGRRNITISSETIQNVVEIQIRDNGKGISNTLINEIFTSGYSLKENSFNLGLGLSFVKEIVENKFGGNILVRSKEGIFTQFNLTLLAHNRN